MEMKDEELVKALVSGNPDLRQHYEEHLEFEKRLRELNKKHYLTPEQEFQRRELQKLKLAGKDRIMEILQQHRPSQAES